MCRALFEYQGYAAWLTNYGHTLYNSGGAVALYPAFRPKYKRTLQSLRRLAVPDTQKKSSSIRSPWRRAEIRAFGTRVSAADLGSQRTPSQPERDGINAGALRS